MNSWLLGDGKNTEGQISVANYDTLIFKIKQHPFGINIKLNEHISDIRTAFHVFLKDSSAPEQLKPFDVVKH